MEATEERDTGGPRMFTIYHDELAIATTSTANEAFAWLLRHQGQSVHYAITHGGYAVRDTQGRDVFADYKEAAK